MNRAQPSPFIPRAIYIKYQYLKQNQVYIHYYCVFQNDKRGTTTKKKTLKS